MAASDHKMMIDALNTMCSTLTELIDKVAAVQAQLDKLQFDAAGRLKTNDIGL